MEIINNFKRKGGAIVRRKDQGVIATYSGKTKQFLLHKKTGDVYRCTEDEFNDHSDEYTQAHGFFG